MPYFVTFQSTQPPTTISLAQTYFKSLLPHLHSSPGFNTFTYYTHPTDTTCGVLVATFEDEEAIVKWQTQQQHLRIQKAAREKVYDDYRIRIGPELEEGLGGVIEQQEDGKGVVVLYSRMLEEGHSAPGSINELISKDDSDGVSDDILDESTYVEAETLRRIWISGWKSEGKARQFVKRLERVVGDETHLFRVERDYSRFKREDAPKNVSTGTEVPGEPIETIENL